MNSSLVENLVTQIKKDMSSAQMEQSVVLMQTHISWIILTGEYAYKIKKPVDFGFLDFSSLAKRKYFCDEELRLNQRFSKDLYLEVLPITGSADCPVLDGKGEAIEYALKMRQFDQAQLLDKVESAFLTPTIAESIGKSIALFHESSAPTARYYDNSVGAAVWSPMEDNFNKIEELIGVDDRSVQAVEEIRDWSRDTYLNRQSLLLEREAGGFVRECHGDLHLGNMLWTTEGCQLFDCLEFSEKLRNIDTMNELAFLLMDLEVKGFTAQANACLNAYLEVSGDFRGLALLKFYKVYRAMVRAKVAIIRYSQLLEEQGAGDSDVEDAYGDYRKYLELAQKETANTPVQLLITHGISGSGKTTVAKRLARKLDAVLLRSDVERKRMFNLDSHQSSKDIEDNIYEQSVSENLFSRLSVTAKGLLEHGYTVIVDATFLNRKHRELFKAQAQLLGVPFGIIACQASLEKIQSWLAARAKDKSEASEADFSIAQQQLDGEYKLQEDEWGYKVDVFTDQDWDEATVVKALVFGAKDEAPICAST